MSSDFCSDFLRHAWALSVKECRQIARDKSALLLGIVLPLVLIVLFGYGLTFDVKNVRVGLVRATETAESTFVAAALEANPTFEVRRFVDQKPAMQALEHFEVEALVMFEEHSGNLRAQLLVDGIDAPRATMVASAVNGALGVAMQRMNAERAGMEGTAGGIEVVPRVWFNESTQSRWYLVPGLFVVVLTITGCMMTSLVIAREWERGTMEALIATPVSPLALLASKTVPYFILGMVGWALCLAAAFLLYAVPLRGSLLVIFAASALYLLMGLALGLVISSVTRSQFLASQITVLVSFLPAVLLSGFIFDLRTAPVWAETFAYLLPPAYFMELLRIGFLTGGMPQIVAKDLAILAFFAAAGFLVAYRCCRKRLAD